MSASDGVLLIAACSALSAIISFVVAISVVRAARESLKIAVDPKELAKVVGTVGPMMWQVTRDGNRIDTLEDRVFGAKP